MEIISNGHMFTGKNVRIGYLGWMSLTALWGLIFNRLTQN